jgi:tape measure domain-containing protein
MSNDQDVKIRLLVENGSLNASVASTNTGLRQMATNVAEVNRAAEGLGQIPEHLAKMAETMEQVKHAAMGLFAFGALKHTVSELIEAQVHLQQIKFTFAAAAGSAEKAAEEFDFVSKTADRLGVSLQSTAETYGTLLVSAKAAHVTLKETHDIFLAVAEAGTVFHLSQQKLHSAMTAVEQMMGQGVIRSQELRMQLGSAIPGAYENFMNRIKAKGLDFNKMMADGKLDIKTYAADLAAAINGSINKTDVDAASQGLNSQLARWSNMIFKFKTSVSGGLFEEAAAATIGQAAKIGEAFIPLVEKFGPVVTVSGLAAGGLLLFGKSVNEAVGKVKSLGAGLLESLGTMRNTGEATLNAAKAAEALAIAEAQAAEVSYASAIRRELDIVQLIAKTEAEASAAAAGLAMARSDVAGAVSAAELAAAEARSTLATMAHVDALAAKSAAQANVQRTGAAMASTAGRAIEQTTAVGVATAGAATKMGFMATAGNLLSKGLSGLVGMLGGLPGILMLAATAIAYFLSQESDEAKVVKELTKAYDDLAKAKTASAIAATIGVAEAATDKAKEDLSDLKDQLAIKQQLAADLAVNSASGTGSASLYSAIKAEKAAEEIEAIKTEIRLMETLHAEKQQVLDIDKQREDVAHNIEAAVSDMNKTETATAALKKKNEAASRGGNNAVKTIEVDAETARKKVHDLNTELSRLAANASGDVANTRALEISQQMADALEKIDRIEKEALKEQAKADALANAKLAIGLNKELAESLKKVNKETAKNLDQAKDKTAADRTDIERHQSLRDQQEQDLKEINKINDATGGHILSLKRRIEATADLAKAYAFAHMSVETLRKAEFARSQQQNYTESIRSAASGFKSAEEMEAEVGRIRVANAQALDIIAKPAEEARLQRNRDLERSMAEEIRTMQEKDADLLKSIHTDGEAATSASLLSVETQLVTDAYKARIKASNDLALAEQERANREGQIALAAFQRDSKKQLLNGTDAENADKFERAKGLVSNTGLTVGSPEYHAALENTIKLMDEVEAHSAKAAVAAELTNTVTGTLSQMLSVDFVDAARNGFDKVLESWGKMLQQMTQDLIKSQIMKAINGLLNIATNALMGGSSGLSAAPMVSADGAGNVGSFDANAGWSLPEFHAAGGPIKGRGTGTSDSIPTWVSNGEYVVQSSAVAKYGVGFLNALNSMQVGAPGGRGYASGGLVGGAASAMSGIGGGTQVNVINNTGQEAKTETKTGPDGKEIIEVIIGRVSNDIRRNGSVGQAIQGTFGASRQGVR